MEADTRHQERDPYQFASARAAGSQDVAGPVSDDVHGMAADRYAAQSHDSGRYYPAFLAPEHRSDDINVGDTERMVSVIGGLALAVAGLSRRSAAGLALAVAGGALIHRGATGHCPVNALTGRNTADNF